MNIFEFDDYRDFLRAKIGEAQQARGYKSALADAAGCQRSAFSQVLGGKMHLSRDHAADLARFLGLDPDEEEYFVLLLDLARAQSKRLTAITRRRLAELKSKRLHRGSVLAEPTIQEVSQQTLYYSSWYWGAVHILTTIPAYQSAAAIAKRIELPLLVVQEALAALQRMGLVQKTGEKWRATKQSIHLPVDSPLNEINHSHWRLRAIQDVQKKNVDSMHYSLVCSMSKADAERLRELLLEQIRKERDLIGPSKEEEVYCLTHDFFRV